MVPPEAPYPDVYTDTLIFFLRPLCKIIWMNVHYFPNAPRNFEKVWSGAPDGRFRKLFLIRYAENFEKKYKQYLFKVTNNDKRNHQLEHLIDSLLQFIVVKHISVFMN